jgi:hypothetical protein
MIDHLRKRSILLPASVTLEKIGLAARALLRRPVDLVIVLQRICRIHLLALILPV